MNFFTFVTRIHKFKVLVANLKNTAVFSGKVDISQVLLYPFCQLDDDKRSVFQVVVSVINGHGSLFNHSSFAFIISVISIAIFRQG